MEIYDFEIEIHGWKDFYENDTRRKQWIKLDCNLMYNPKIQKLNPVEFRLFVALLTFAGGQGSALVRSTFGHVSDAVRLRVGSTTERRLKSVSRALNRLEELRLVKVTYLADGCHEYGARIDKNRKEKNNILVQLAETPKQDAERLSSPQAPVFDFENLYLKYPRKEGKTKGILKCKATIKTKASFDELSRAIENYARKCEQEVIEKRYVKLFSSFMSCWRDYVDYECEHKSKSIYQLLQEEKERKFGKISISESNAEAL